MKYSTNLNVTPWFNRILVFLFSFVFDKKVTNCILTKSHNFFSTSFKCPPQLGVRRQSKWEPDGCWWLAAPLALAWLWPCGSPMMNGDAFKVNSPRSAWIYFYLFHLLFFYKKDLLRTNFHLQRWPGERTCLQLLTCAVCSLFVWDSGRHHEGSWETGSFGGSSWWLIK